MRQLCRKRVDGESSEWREIWCCSDIIVVELVAATTVDDTIFRQ